MKSKIKYLPILLLIAISKLLSQSTYVVDSATEITQAMVVAMPGDTLVMSSGFWTNEKIVFEGNGTENNHIVLKAEIPGQVVLNGTSTLRISGSYLTVDGLYFYGGYSGSGAIVEFRNGSSKLANNCRFTNSAIVNYNPANKSTDYKWVSLFGTYNRVDNCYFEGKTHDGTTLVVWLDGKPNYHLIDNNYFAKRPELGYNGGETIRIGTSTYSLTDSYTTVEYNYFEHCDGEIEIISNKSGHNIFRYNTFFENNGMLTLRHGNFAEVYGNFFLGNNYSNSGGVRIIGEDHKVYNNYFSDLRGSGFRSALTIMNGVPNSPLNRYYRVQRALVVNNTFVNCTETFNICEGSDSELSLPPIDCIIANNVVKATRQIIDYDEDDEPVNLKYEGNIFYGGSLGIDPVNGISTEDGKLAESLDGLWRPLDDSPVIDASIGTYDFVTDDMDGQSRSGTTDIGADEKSTDPIIHKPLTGDDVGPNWYPPPTPAIKVIKVQAGADSLLNAINKKGRDDIIELITDGGIYTISGEITVDSELIIRGADSLTNNPIIQNISASSSKSIFVLDDGAYLDLSNVELDGLAGTNNPAKYLIRTDSNPMTKDYKLKVRNSFLRDVVSGSEGNFFRAYEGTFADTIIFAHCLFTNAGKEGIRLKDEQTNSGKYNVGYFRISNSTFWNTKREAINIYGGDAVLFTPGPEFQIISSTFYKCGIDGTPIIETKDTDDTEIINCIFAESNHNISVSLYSQIAELSYSSFYNVGEIELNNNAKIGTGIVNYDPKFEDPSSSNFSITGSSFTLKSSDKSGPLGDPRWAVNSPEFTKLSITVFGEGSVATEPDSNGLFFDLNSSITVTAIPGENYNFTQWSGDLSGNDISAPLVMDSDKSIFAIFELSTDVEFELAPNEYKLHPVFPNPFNPSTQINFQLKEQAFVNISIYNTIGEKVQTLIAEIYSTGHHSLHWQPNNLGSGIYIVRMVTDNYVFTQKAILIK
ncbi:MAG: DUF4957 domain-containing protein [Melioribacteraceae bacterium]|nr:DUF4957 domain-containing protein [Melioribacteraceae bacterium]MCF8265145.1 DUF4957 domain-containing protein [Melioribacteraceae bacterium]MCF8432368.1 DUF4957 domain-containing protein [Melioribacteraceae bacterium]